MSWLDGLPRVDANKTLTQQVYELLRQRIVRGEYEPRLFLREADVGAGMGVSRTPVREALNRLASEGFLERVPRRGFRIPEQSMETLVHVYPVLRALEVLAGELAFPRLTGTELAELEAANVEYARALADHDVAAAVEWNEEFHRRLSRMSGNPILCEILDDLRSQVQRLEVLDFSRLLDGEGDPSAPAPEEWVRQHAEVIEAVRRGDYERAREVLRTNRSLVSQADMAHVPGPAATG